MEAGRSGSASGSRPASRGVLRALSGGRHPRRSWSSCPSPSRTWTSTSGWSGSKRGHPDGRGPLVGGAGGARALHRVLAPAERRHDGRRPGRGRAGRPAGRPRPAQLRPADGRRRPAWPTTRRPTAPTVAIGEHRPPTRWPRCACTAGGETTRRPLGGRHRHRLRDLDAGRRRRRHPPAAVRPHPVRLHAAHLAALDRHVPGRPPGLAMRGAAAGAGPPASTGATSKVGTRLPALWTQRGATSAPRPTWVVDVGGRGGRRSWGRPRPAGTPQPGTLWIGLPEPAAVVPLTVGVPGDDWVTLRAWAGDGTGQRPARRPGRASCGSRRRRRDRRGHHRDGASASSRRCPASAGSPQADADAQAGLESGAGGAGDGGRALVERRAGARARQPLPPGGHHPGAAARRTATRSSGSKDRTPCSSRPAARPASCPAWVADPPPPAPNTSVRFPHGGVLADLAAYVRWTIPDPGAVPVFRAYDLGCEFDASHVQQMYGADLRIRLRDGNGRPVLDAAGAELVFAQRLGGGADDDADHRASPPGYAAGRVHRGGRVDDAGGRRRDAEPGRRACSTTTSPASSLTGGRRWCSTRPRRAPPTGTSTAACCARTSTIAGGDAAAGSPDKPGTVVHGRRRRRRRRRRRDPGLGRDGAYGLVFRWRATGDHYRFSVEPQRSAW